MSEDRPPGTEDDEPAPEQRHPVADPQRLEQWRQVSASSAARQVAWVRYRTRREAG